MLHLLRELFGCSHRRCTFPRSPVGQQGKRTTQVCLDCGAEFEYNWAEMRRGKKIEQRRLSVVARRIA